MKRSKTQAVYKILPGMWIGVNDAQTVTALVKNWNYKKMEGIYSNFIENEIKRQIRLFGMRGGNIKDFNLNDENSMLIVESACREGIPDITVSLSPLLYYCPECHRMKQFSSAKEVNDACPYCSKGKLKQLPLVYPCECGYAEPVTLPYIEGVHEFYYYPTKKQYAVYYKQGKNEYCKDFGKNCPNCGNKINRDSATANNNYKAFTANIINLIDEKLGKFYEQGIDACKVVIAKWFNKLSEANFKKIVENVPHSFSDNIEIEIKEKVMEEVNMLLSIGVIDESKVDLTVNTLLEKHLKNEANAQSCRIICDNLFSKKKNSMAVDYDRWVNNFAFNLMQYETIKNVEHIVTLDDGIRQQISMGFIEDLRDIEQMNAKLGIKSVQASCDVVIVSGSYGYTRKSTDPSISKSPHGLKLVAFEKDGTKNLVYGTKLETEGILFDIDRNKILQWLLTNNIITQEEMPDIEDEYAVKKWFADNVNSDKISSFSKIDDKDKITKNVFTLLHSISHAFLKTAGEMSGISVNSLTEIIFVDTCSIFIYAQSGQGQVLGSLSGMFETLYLKYLNRVYAENRDCIFDPICADRDGSVCQGCLILADTTCSYFNENLGRKYLYNLNNNKKFVGFWEM